MIDTEPRYWEPRTFAVGDRVRIRLSPECALRITWAPSGTITGHLEEEDGRTGTVITKEEACRVVRIPIDAMHTPMSHPYLVRFDERFFICPGQAAFSAHYAAVELIPLEDQCPES